MTDALDGVLVVDKPEGVTSHDVVAAVRRRLPRGTKVGHTGTLDPLATGVLPVIVGKATRLAQFLTATRKTYVADVAFGTATDTCDAAGAPIATAAEHATGSLEPAALIGALGTFVGTHPQVPPAYSAKKIAGERAYVLARRGAEVDLPAVEVTAHALELVSWDPVRLVAVVRLECSAGYYVRSLARDLGTALGVPAHLSALRRVGSGAFTVEHARPFGEVVQADAEMLQAWRVPLRRLLSDLPSISLDGSQARAVLHGQPFVLEGEQVQALRSRDVRVRLLDEAGELIALARHVPPGSRLHADIVLA